MDITQRVQVMEEVEMEVVQDSFVYSSLPNLILEIEMWRSCKAFYCNFYCNNKIGGDLIVFHEHEIYIDK